MPWVQRDRAAAYQLLVEARRGRAPQRPVERLALLQLLMQLHRQALQRTGGPRTFNLVLPLPLTLMAYSHAAVARVHQ